MPITLTNDEYRALHTWARTGAEEEGQLVSFLALRGKEVRLRTRDLELRIETKGPL